MPFTIPEINLIPLLPAIIPAVTAMVIMLADVLLPGKTKSWLSIVALAGLAIAAAAAFWLYGPSQSAFNQSVSTSPFALGVSLVVLGAGFITVLISVDYLKARDLDFGEYLALLLGAISGMVLMALANDLIVIFLGLELFSLPLYVLSAFWRTNTMSLEAGMKYFLLGAFSSAFFLYGIALVYGATGSTNLIVIGQSAVSGHNVLFTMGVALLLIGFGFKVGLVPFQWWMPDVYEGAPTPITGFMSVATKGAAFAAFFRTFVVMVYPVMLNTTPPTVDWSLVLAVLAVLTMTVGNIAALTQTNIKRMLAYSSIAHAGYILIALAVGTEQGVSAALFYLAAYGVMNLAAFGGIIALGDGTRERVNFSDLSGAARQKPWAAAALAVALFSLAGFPPFAGFVAKFFVFNAAIQANYTWLAVIGVVNSLISVYYYLGPIVRMYMNPPSTEWEQAPSRIPALLALAVVIAVVLTLGLGLFPSELIQFAEAAK